MLVFKGKTCTAQFLIAKRKRHGYTYSYTGLHMGFHPVTLYGRTVRVNPNTWSKRCLFTQKYDFLCGNVIFLRAARVFRSPVFAGFSAATVEVLPGCRSRPR